jgi:PKD repeat protein
MATLAPQRPGVRGTGPGTRPRGDGGGPRQWLPRLLLAAVVLAGGGALVAGHARAVSARSVALDDASAWLLSTRAGEAELVDGNAAQTVTHVSLGPGPLSGAQSGVTDFVVDSATGMIRRIDGATYQVSAPVRFDRPGEALAVYPAAHVLFVVDLSVGLVRVVDPDTLVTLGAYSLSARVPAGGVVTDGGDGLWAVDAASGDLERVDRFGTTIQTRAVDPAHTLLTTVAGRPVAVDLSAHRAWALGAGGIHGAGACVDSAVGDTTVSVVGSSSAPLLFLTSGKRGLLLVTDLTTGRCGQAVDLGVPGDTLGQPREAAGRVFIPDFTTGRVLVVDVADARLVADRAVLPAPTSFELREQGSTVFFNDPLTSRAGVVALDGTVRDLQKYDPTQPGPGVGDAQATGGTGTGQGGRGTGGPAGPGVATTAPSTSPRQGSQPTTGPARSPQNQVQQPVVVSSTSAGPLPAAVRIEVSAPQVKVGTALTLRAVVIDAAGQPTTSGISSVSWEFGDRLSASGAQVTHAWASQGLYQVAATVGLADGTTASPVADVTVTARTPPSARISVTPTEGFTPLMVTADASASVAGDAPVNAYRFDFGDGSQPVSSGTGTATHPYARAGVYTVSVTVTDTAGQSGAAASTVTVRSSDPGVTAALSLSASQGTAPLAVTATASSSTGVAPFSYVFDWGDGHSDQSTSGTATHSYPAAGSYRVSVKITDADGQTGSQTSPLTVTGGRLVAALVARPSSGQVPLTVTFDASGSTGGTAPYTYTFDLGSPYGGHPPPPSPQASPTTTVTYPSLPMGGGPGTITVTVTDATGATSTASATVDPTDVPPTPRLAVTQTAPGTATLDASGSTAGGTAISGYLFGFASQGTWQVTASSVTLSGLTAGTWNFSVQVVDKAGGISKSATVTVQISPGAPAPAGTWTETATADTTTDPVVNYTDDTVPAGATIEPNTSVGVYCWVTGSTLAGDAYWYRIAGSPWLYVSAHYFYNNGATSGAQSGVPVDPAVPAC